MGLLCKGSAELLHVVFSVIGEGGDNVGAVVGCCGALFVLMGAVVGGGVGVLVGAVVGCLVGNGVGFDVGAVVGCFVG
jgi:hypothetical protein